MNRIPNVISSLFNEFAREFTPTVWQRFLSLMTAAILVHGRRTIWRLLQCGAVHQEGHFSSYHRVFSQRRWSSVGLTRRLALAVVDRFAPAGVLQLVGDDTVSQHRGASVYGKGCHRDAVRSSHNHLVHRWGHKWVVLALRVKVQGARRTWALPVLVALYRTPEESTRLGLRHKTPPELMQGLLCVWLRWFPQRKSVFSADGGFATHRLSQFASKHSVQLSLVSKIVPGAVLHELPSGRQPGRLGRPRIIGKRLPSPEQAVAQSTIRRRLNVQWYGGGVRRVEIASGTGNWYRQGRGLVKIRWVYVRDLTGDHRDEYFYSTDAAMSAAKIIEAFVGRWDIEVMFEEMREHLGLETTRGRAKNTVLRAEPCLFMLYTLIVLWYVHIGSSSNSAILYHWPGKSSITFTDTIASVRRSVWENYIFQQPEFGGHVEKLPAQTRKAILDALSLAT